MFQKLHWDLLSFLQVNQDVSDVFLVRQEPLLWNDDFASSSWMQLFPVVTGEVT